MKDAYKKMKAVKGELDKLKKKDRVRSGKEKSSRSRSDSPEKPKLQKYWSKSQGKYVFASLSRSPTASPPPNGRTNKLVHGKDQASRDQQQFFEKVVRELNNSATPPSGPPPPM